MITSIFKKSTPINYILILFLSVFFYGLYQSKHGIVEFSAIGIGLKVGVFILLLGLFFFTNFIIKKNGLSKDSTYTVFFFLLFLLFFPTIFDNSRLIVANFFVLLGFRKVISLQTLNAPKEKIFDATICICIASLFHFWAILFLFLVFISIFIHVARDYRHWTLPFLGFVTIAVIFVMLALQFDKTWITYLINNSSTSFKIDYFQNVYQNISFSLYTTVALFFVVSLLISLPNRPLILQSSYNKILTAFVIGVIIYMISPEKSNDLLLFTIAPLAMMATFYIEWSQIKWQKEVTLYTLLAIGLFTFLSQL
jgi:Family of unknown function (DUF6427)